MGEPDLCRGFKLIIAIVSNYIANPYIVYFLLTKPDSTFHLIYTLKAAGKPVLETICTGEYKSEVDKIHDIQSKARSKFKTQCNKKFIQLSQNKSQSFGINQLTDHKKMCKRMFLNLYD